MENNIQFQKIIRKNLSLASKIQNEIFPKEDGTQNFIDCIEQNSYRKELDFWIAYNKQVPIRNFGNLCLS